jgi:transposase
MPVSDGMRYAPKLLTRARSARDKGDRQLKKVSTGIAKKVEKVEGHKLTIGLDLGDRFSWYCVLNEAGEVVLEQKLATTPKAHARNVRLIGESRKKDDRLDARTLARLVRIDPQLLAPVKHRSAQAQAHLMVIRARAGLVRARTSLINTARGLTKSYGERLRGCNPRNLNPEKAQGLSPELQTALEPLLGEIESLSERIREYSERMEEIAKATYPEVAWLKQVKGVGTLIALTYVLTLEYAHRFGKSRDVGCYVGLQPGRRNSGQSEPQLHISKEGDPYLRTLLVQGAHHILGPFGADCDLRRWGLKLAERGGKIGKKRAVIAVARKLAVLLHRLTGLSRNASQYNNFQSKVDSNPIAHRVRRKRQRLTSSLLIENGLGSRFCSTPKTCPEAFPIKASDKPEVIRQCGFRRGNGCDLGCRGAGSIMAFLCQIHFADENWNLPIW